MDSFGGALFSAPEKWRPQADLKQRAERTDGLLLQAYVKVDFFDIYATVLLAHFVSFWTLYFL